MKTNNSTSQSLQVSLHPVKDVIARVGGCVHVQVRVEPPTPAHRPNRKPVALALVVDRSGSMGSPAAPVLAPGSPASTTSDFGMPDKMSFVKEACQRLLDVMVDGDLVSVVAFDDRVQVVKPMTRIDASTRSVLAEAVSSITLGGSTYLEGGIRAGYDQFTAPIRKGHSCKLLLLSDGEANVGEQSPAVLAERSAGAAHNGTVTSTLGVGFDYNIGLMTHLAEVGNGDFTHIEAIQDLDTQLREELEAAADVTARAATVTITVPEQVSVGTNMNGYPQETQESGFKVNLGDLVRPKGFIFECTTPIDLGSDQLVIHARVDYQDPAGVAQLVEAEVAIGVVSATEASTAPALAELVEQVVATVAARVIHESTGLYDAGDRHTALERLKDHEATMDRVEKAYSKELLDDPTLLHAKARLAELSADASSGVLSAVDSKRMHMTQERMLRSRIPNEPKDRPDPPLEPPVT
jgi:Ca-activated chloride channel homolog